MQISGPVFGGGGNALAAFVARGKHAGRVRTLLFAAPREILSPDEVRALLPDLFSLILESVIKSLKVLPAGVAVTATVVGRKEDKWEIQTSVSEPGNADANALAEDFLRTLRIVETVQDGDDRLRLEETAAPPAEQLREIRVSRPSKLLDALVVVTAQAKEKLAGLLPGILDVVENEEAKRYLLESRLRLQGGRPVSAFRDFWYAMTLWDRAPVEALPEAVGLGHDLINVLMQTGRLDFAEWVAIRLADATEDAGDIDSAVEFLRHAAICSESHGSLADISQKYDRMLLLLPGVRDARRKTRLMMSLGISLVQLSLHWDTEAVHTRSAALEMEAVLCRAREALDAALHFLSTVVDERARRSRCAIELDQLRIADLLGDHQGVLVRLDDLRGSDRFVPEPRLLATWFAYRAAALQTLARHDPACCGRRNEAVNACIQTLNKFQRQMKQPHDAEGGTGPAPVFCPHLRCFALLLAAEACEAGAAGVSKIAGDPVALLREAYKLQKRSLFRSPAAPCGGELWRLAVHRFLRKVAACTDRFGR